MRRSLLCLTLELSSAEMLFVSLGCHCHRRHHLVCRRRLPPSPSPAEIQSFSGFQRNVSVAEQTTAVLPYHDVFASSLFFDGSYFIASVNVCSSSYVASDGGMQLRSFAFFCPPCILLSVRIFDLWLLFYFE